MSTIDNGAIYGITPCTKEAAEKAIDAMATRTLTLVSIAPERALPGPPDPDYGGEPSDPDDEAEFDDDESDDDDVRTDKLP